MKEFLRRFRMPIVVGIVIVLLSFSLRERQGPYYLARNVDPSYTYFMNALLLADLRAPVYWDHPGTPVQMIGGITLRLRHPFASRHELGKTVLRNPEPEIYWMSVLYVLVATLVVGWALHVAAERFGGARYGLVFGAFAFLNPEVWDRVPQFMPDYLVFALGLAFAATAYSRRPRKFAELGALTGATVITKITGAPVTLLSGVALWRQPRRQWLLYAGAVLAAMVLCFLPNLRPGIVGDLMSWTGWLGRLVHQAPDYADNAGLGDGLAQFAKLCVGHPLLPLAVLLGFRLWPEPIPVAGSLLIVLQYLIVLRHPAQRYLLPVSGVAALTWTIAYVRWVDGRAWGRYVPTGLTGLALSLGLFMAADRQTRDDNLADVSAAVAEAQRVGCRVVPFQMADTQELAVNIAKFFEKVELQKDLAEVYPGYMIYDEALGEFQDHAGHAVPLEKLKGEKLCLMGGRKLREFPFARFEPLRPSKFQNSLYLVHWN